VHEMLRATANLRKHCPLRLGNVPEIVLQYADTFVRNIRFPQIFVHILAKYPMQLGVKRTRDVALGVLRGHVFLEEVSNDEFSHFIRARSLSAIVRVASLSVRGRVIVVVGVLSEISPSVHHGHRHGLLVFLNLGLPDFNLLKQVLRVHPAKGRGGRG